jgi:hypothetical protein
MVREIKRLEAEVARLELALAETERMWREERRARLLAESVPLVKQKSVPGKLFALFGGISHAGRGDGMGLHPCDPQNRFFEKDGR